MTRKGKKGEPSAVPAEPPKPAGEADPADPEHQEWLIDEADEESFPASDPSSIAQPHRKPGKKPK